MVARAALLVWGLLAVSLLAAGCREEPRPLTFAPDALPAASLGQPYRAEITVSGNRTPVGSMAVDPSTLPPGLELHHTDGQDSGVIEGVPRIAGEYSFTIDVWCYGTNVSGQTGSRPYRLAVR